MSISPAVGPQAAGRLAFACAWGSNEAETWSGTPFLLRAALARTGPVVNLRADLPAPLRAGLKVAAARRVEGRWVSLWKHGSLARRLTEHRLAAAAEAAGCPAAISIQDLGVLPIPYLVVQDLSYDVLLERYPEGGVPHFPSLSRSALQRLRDRQHRVYQQAAALLPMSRWLAEELVRSGVPRSKVFPVHPGLNVPTDLDVPVPTRRDRPTRRLLFVGRDPQTKALDLVIAGFARLRADLGAAIELTVAGPPHWPMPGPVPAGVSFLGPVGRPRIAELMDSHDLFVMPSRMEGFGIVFVEALARGLPCIGRNAFAMPEIIRPGTGGALIDDDDPDRLARTIESALADDGLYQRCAAAAVQVRQHYSWDRAAAEVRDVVLRVTS